MSKDEILALSGYALSEAIAIHVMRWQRVATAENVNRVGSTWAAPDGAWYFIPHRELRPQATGLLDIVAETWEPHKDIKAAWKIVDWIGMHDRVHWHITGHACANRFAVIADGESVLKSSFAESALIETAILHAALLAVLSS